MPAHDYDDKQGALKLRPSSAYRWLHCAAAPRLEATMPHESSVYAVEGTLAARLGELEWSLQCGKPLSGDERLEREQLAEDTERRLNIEAWLAAVDSLRGKIGWDFCTPELAIPLDDLEPGMQGHADVAGMYTRDDGTTVVVISDLKYGVGVRVSAINNSQIMLYGWGLAQVFRRLFGFAANARVEVLTHIFQPRIENGESICIHPFTDLDTWVEETVRPAISAVHDPASKPVPGEWCKFCRASGLCRARVLLCDDVPDPTQAGLLTPSEVAVWLERAPQIKATLSAIETQALNDVIAGKTIPGWSLYRGSGQRTIVDDEGARRRLDAAGIPASEYQRATLPPLQTLTVLDRLAGGKNKLADILGDSLGLTIGKLKLAPDGGAEKVQEVNKMFATKY